MTARSKLTSGTMVAWRIRYGGFSLCSKGVFEVWWILNLRRDPTCIRADAKIAALIVLRLSDERNGSGCVNVVSGSGYITSNWRNRIDVVRTSKITIGLEWALVISEVGLRYALKKPTYNSFKNHPGLQVKNVPAPVGRVVQILGFHPGRGSSRRHRANRIILCNWLKHGLEVRFN